MKTTKKWLATLAFIFTLSSLDKVETMAKTPEEIEILEDYTIDKLLENSNTKPNALYLKNNEIATEALYDTKISSDAIYNVIQNDLYSIKSSTTGFNDQYFILNQALQAFYEIYGRNTITEQAKSKEFLKKLYEELQNIGLEKAEITSFFKDSKSLYELYQKENTSYLEENELNQKDIYTLHIVETLINIYNKKTNQNWKNSKKMNAIILSMIQKIDLEAYPNIIDKDILVELKSLKQNPMFLNEYCIDLINAQNIKVVIDSENPNFGGNFCLTFQTIDWMGEEMPDTFCFAFNENDKIENIKSYNSLVEQRRIKIMSYGITEEEDIEFCMNNTFFMAYETTIYNTPILSEYDKEYLMKNFMNFKELHKEFFKSETSSDILQILFSRAIKACSSRNQVFNIIANENALYELGGEEYQQELASFGITNLEEQKFYIQNIVMFNNFINILHSNHRLNLTAEEMKTNIVLFKEYLKNNEILENLSDEEKQAYVYELFQNKSEGEIFIILKSNITPELQELKREKVIYARA